jgi:hypothetical protein
MSPAAASGVELDAVPCDLALALEILTPGLLCHPDSGELAELRQEVLVRLMEQHQLSDPFRFLVYAELAAAEISPVG